MSISATQWRLIVARVRVHTAALYPNDPTKAGRVANELLRISTLEERWEGLREKQKRLAPEKVPSKRPWWKFR